MPRVTGVRTGGHRGECRARVLTHEQVPSARATNASTGGRPIQVPAGNTQELARKTHTESGRMSHSAPLSTTFVRHAPANRSAIQTPTENSCTRTPPEEGKARDVLSLRGEKGPTCKTENRRRNPPDLRHVTGLEDIVKVKK